MRCLLIISFLFLFNLPAISQVDTASTTKKESLPINPDSIYHIISPVSEPMVDGQEIPRQLSVSEWEEDLDTLAAAMRQRIPYYESAVGGHDQFLQQIDSLKSLLPEQSRDQRILSVMKLLNLPAPGTGHTGLRTSQRAINWRALPLYPYGFADGVYIMSAGNPDLIGSELLAIGETPIDSVYAALVAPYVSADNRWDRQRAVEPWPLQHLWVNPLRSLGIVDQIDQIPVQIRTKDGDIRDISLKTMRPNSASYVRFITSDSLRIETPPELQWSPATRRSQDNNEPNYQITYRDSTNIIYLQFNAVENASSEWTVADLADSLRHIADTKPLEKVVVDLRTNNGGNAGLVEPLVELFANHPKIDQHGVLYTLVSPITYSAAGMFAMELERRTKTIFAGEPGGFAPNIWGEFAPLLLPNSKITVFLSYAYKLEGMPNTPRTYLEPDLYIPLTSNQHFCNIDSTMIAVRNHEPEPLDTTKITPNVRKKFSGTYRLSPVHITRITETEKGLHFRMIEEGPEPYIDMELYPLSPTQLATDISNVFLERTPGQNGLTLVWKDTTYALTPAESDAQSPIQKIHAGHIEEGANELRSILNDGWMLGDNFTESSLSDLMEEPLPIWPDSLSQRERAKRALPYQKLAVELAPMSWRVHADLAQVYKALGRSDDAIEALKKVKELYPARYEDMIEYLELKKYTNSEDS